MSGRKDKSIKELRCNTQYMDKNRSGYFDIIKLRTQRKVDINVCSEYQINSTANAIRTPWACSPEAKFHFIEIIHIGQFQATSLGKAVQNIACFYVSGFGLHHHADWSQLTVWEEQSGTTRTKKAILSMTRKVKLQDCLDQGLVLARKQNTSAPVPAATRMIASAPNIFGNCL